MRTSEVRCGWLATILLAFGFQSTSAHEPAATPPSTGVAVPAAAAPAVAVVDAFGAALRAGDRARIEELLDPEVVIMESGTTEHGRAEYLAHHAGEDIAFLHGANVSLNRRTAEAADGLAIVISESTIHARGKDGPIELTSSETMVLHQGDHGWRIAQVHWSSHRTSAGR